MTLCGLIDTCLFIGPPLGALGPLWCIVNHAFVCVAPLSGVRLDGEELVSWVLECYPRPVAGSEHSSPECH